MSEQTPEVPEKGPLDLVVGLVGTCEFEVIKGPGESVPTLGQDEE